MGKYKIDFREINKKWAKEWYSKGIFNADPIDNKKKFFVNAPYPYLNAPLHLGHGYTYVTADIIARYKRLRGYNVLFPFAFHATGTTIVSISIRLKENDPKIKEILRISGIPEELFKKFEDPYFIVNYIKERDKNTVTLYGLSIDTRRFFTTIDEDYKKFIQWQYTKLKEKGLVIQGTHPVIWCPRCKSPTGSHDRLKGDEATVVEYYLIKFKVRNFKGYKELVLPCGTLRPETTYGVTNIWINPDSIYVIAKVDGSKWIISKEAVIKLREQLRRVDILEEFYGKELIGKKAINPVNEKEILILPAKFVDSNVATGVVMSVPAHAPYDWIALQDLKKNIREIKSVYDLDDKIVEEIERIKPIIIIAAPTFKDIPAKEACEKFGVKSQEDVKELEEATSYVYKEEFYKGICLSNCGPFEGKKVCEIKDELINYFRKEGFADSMFETSEPVICRCNTRCYVKILENQWFLKYSDKKWKEKVKKWIDKMKITPEEYKEVFKKVVDWLNDKACARQTGLGTPLPWDPSWIVETLSDSVIYMAFYTIVHKIRELKIDVEKLNEKFFDYIFLGIGDVDELSKELGIDKEKIEEIRQEFEYWYGFDLRASAKELVPNHLTFALFHHVAIWNNEKYWPKWFSVNGMIMVEGVKMSKRLGNFIVLDDVINKYGADVVRITLASSSEGSYDPSWEEKKAEAWSKRLYEIYAFYADNWGKINDKLERDIDRWLVEKAKERLKKGYQYLEDGKWKSAVDEVINGIWNDIKWYVFRAKDTLSKGLKTVLEWYIMFLSIYAPFIAEEIWKNIMKREGYVALARLPEIEEINYKDITREEVIRQVYEDILEIFKVLKHKPKIMKIAIPDEWKYRLFKELEKGKEISDLVREIPECKKYAKYIREWKEKKAFYLEDRNEELELIKKNVDFFKEKFKLEEVYVIEERDLPESKKRYCIPGRFAIIFE